MFFKFDVVVFCIIFLFVFILLVNDIFFMLGLFVSYWFICVVFWIILNMLLGMLVLVKILVSLSVFIGVFFDGLNINVLFVVRVGFDF